MRNVKSILLALCSAVFVLGCVKDLEVNIEFNEAAYELSVGDTLDVSTEVKVENTVESPKFSSSDEAVAKFVSGASLVALAPGEVKVTASVAGKEATAQVKINAVLAKKIVLEAPDTVVAAANEWTRVVAKVEPGNYNYEDLKWTFTAGEESGLEYVKVTASEYKFKVANYVEGDKVVVTVADKNSDVSQSATIKVTKKEDSTVDPVDPENPGNSEDPENPGDSNEDQVAAKIVRLNAPSSITESDKTWGTVTAEVVAEGTGEYDYTNLSWEFTPSDAEATGFAYEKVSDSQYNVRFTAYKEGANVSVKVTDKVGGRFAVKTIAVDQKPAEGATSIELSLKTLTLFVDETTTLKANCAPSSYDQTLLVWESSDTKVVTVNNGVIKAIAEGVAKVKVTDSISGISAECEVTVKVPVTEVVVKTVVLETNKLTLTEGEGTYQFKPVCYDADNNEVKDFAGLVWSASKDVNADGEYDVVEVSSQGIVTPKAVGFSIVTVAVESNQAVKATCEVTVVAKEIKVEKMTLSPAEHSIDVGQQYTLGVTTEPDLSLVDNKTLTFVSNNPEVATVSEEGLVKGISYGEAEITVTAASGVSAVAKVTVRQETGDEPEVTDFEINLEIANEPDGENMTLAQFETLDIKFSYTNGYIAKNTTWEVSDPTLVKVTAHDTYAVVEAIYDGMMTNDEKKTVTITHRAGAQEASKTIDIVRARPKSIEFVGLPEGNILYLGDTFGPDFRAKVYPEQASQDVTYWGAPEVFSVANGSRPAFKTGYYTLSATAHYMGDTVSEVTTTVNITVKAKAVEGGTLSNPTLLLEEGRDATLVVDFMPANNENYDYSVVWASSNPDVATVKDGKVTAVAEGTATVTATLSNGDVLTCEVTVTAPAPVYANVGDYYYSDGTVSSELDPSKTVIGVVFSVDNPTQMGDTKLSSDHPRATHGLVMALEETADIIWQKVADNVGAWAVANMNYNYLQSTDRKCGYSNTQALKAYNAVCAADNKVLVADCAPKIELPSNTSGWYLPSYAEWDMLFKYEQGTRTEMISNGEIARKIEAAGGTPFSIIRQNFNNPDGAQDAPSYWASTESSTSSTWATCMHFLHGGQTNRSKNGKTYYIARYIFAF